MLTNKAIKITPIKALHDKTESLRSKLDKTEADQARAIEVAKKIDTKTVEVTILKGFLPEYLDKWVRAWEQQDIELYLSFYSKEFKGSKQRHEDWRTYRQAALKKHTSISIQLKNIEISKNKDNIEISFTQNFKSPEHSDIGTKKLVWVRNGSVWRIIKETWTRKRLPNMGWQYQ